VRVGCLGTTALCIAYTALDGPQDSMQSHSVALALHFNLPRIEPLAR